MTSNDQQAHRHVAAPGPGVSPVTSPAASPVRARRRRPRRWLRAIVLVVLVTVGWLSWSVGRTLAAPGDDSVTARLAEWGRDHGLGAVVLGAEKLKYREHPPAIGGAPPAGVLHAPAPSTAGPAGRSRPPAIGAAGRRHGAGALTVAIRHPLAPFAHPALAGEGQWRGLVTVHGQPAVQAAFLRPDDRHTSYLSGVAWMSSRLLRFELHPGFDQPGGTWPVPDRISPSQRPGLAATWNGAFKLADARGGFYLDGRTAGTLVDGAASEVFYRNGTLDVGTWNHQVRMTPAVVGVRQNLGLLVDHGAIRPSVDSSPLFHWGLTLGGDYYVFRSGVGVTRQGDVVYVSGDALSAGTLARLLQRAGCVRAMELDINPAWISYMSYRTGPGGTVPHRLLPDYQRPANRYFEHTSRDFVAAYAR